MIKILHLSDIHLGSGFSHGRINPETGLNTRLEDFIKTLISVLFLAYDNKIKVYQRKFPYGKIFIETMGYT